MPEPGEYNQLQARSGPSTPYLVKLLLAAPDRPDPAALLAALRRTSPTVKRMNDGDDILSFVHPDLTTNFADAQAVPLMQSVLPAAPVADHRADLDVALSQTWDWPLARDVVSRAKHVVVLTDMMGAGVPRAERLHAFVRFVRATASLLSPLAVHWLPSQRVVSPEAFAGEDEVAIGHAAVNVRMFRISNGAAGEIVMDTLGLAAFGLPDLQCHFAGLDPGRVAGVLFGYAEYLFAKGDVLEDGNTVEGVQPGSRWACRHEVALVPPEREVVDLHPGDARP